MESILDHQIESLIAISKKFLSEFGPLTTEELNFKPNTSQWSIAQVMDHIIKTNESYYPVFDAVKNGTNKVPFIGQIPFIPTLIGNMLIKALDPDNKKKTKTMTIWNPSESMIEGIIMRFEKHHDELITRLKSVAPFLDNIIVISSPANKYVVYTLNQALEIIEVHERRHLIQAQSVLQVLRSAKETMGLPL